MATADNIERTGVIEGPNISLLKRKPVRTPDGNYATVYSMSFSDQTGVEILIPTVVNGRLVSLQQAIDHYYKTGEHLGKYTSVEAANKAAQRIHEAEAKRIAAMGYGKMRVRPVDRTRYR